MLVILKIYIFNCLQLNAAAVYFNVDFFLGIIKTEKRTTASVKWLSKVNKKVGVYRETGPEDRVDKKYIMRKDILMESGESWSVCDPKGPPRRNRHPA